MKSHDRGVHAAQSPSYIDEMEKGRDMGLLKRAVMEDSTVTGSREFGDVIRDRRRQLDLTQREVAMRIRTSVPYVGHLESGKRHPSEKILIRLAEVLGLDHRELFFLANPNTEVLFGSANAPADTSAWEEFSKDDRLHRLHRITTREMHMLSQVALMGHVRSTRDFVYILNTVRQALSS